VTRNLHNYLLFTLLLLSSNILLSQQISVDSSVGLQQLIEDNLVQNSCVDITNITSSINGTSNGLSSYAYFERGTSNFPFANGIMLSTGNASSGGNGLITPILSEGSSAWGTDPDLETALGITNTVNATSIEFDIVSISNQLQFNYLLASEEYFGINPCQFSDGFVFLIKETGNPGPYQNIALVPGSSTPVNTNTIHDEIFGVCPAQNDQYFDGYNIGDTNYNGRTTVLTAFATIVPYVQYHIKLIIADQTDGTFDSAVFIEGNSFKILDLGDDIVTCTSSTILNADIQNPLATYQWFFNNSTTPIPGENGSTLNVIQNGTYKVEVTVPLNNSNCIEEDEILVTLNTEEPINSITDYEQCDDVSGDSIEVFDLSTKSAELAANIPFTNYTFSYHYSDTDARSNINEITTPISNTSNPQTIYVRIDDLDSNCFAYTTFNLVVNTLPNSTPSILDVCDSDDTPDGFTVIDLTQKDDEITGGSTNLIVTYHYSQPDANSGINAIPNLYVNQNRPTDILYVRIINTQTGCISTTTLTVNVTVSPIINRDTQYLDACDRDLDGSAIFDLTERTNDILQGLGGVITTFYESYSDAQDGINQITDPANYQYDNPQSEPGFRTIFVRVEDATTGCASIVPLEIHTNLLLTGTDTGDFALCDNNDDTNDALSFNLFTVEAYIANDLPFPIIVTFYDSENDRDTDINPIPKNILYPVTVNKVLYIRIENTDSGCSEVADITLLVNPILVFNPATPLPYCDTDDDGIVSIDLHSLDETVTNGNTDFEVTYFPTLTDAENNTNQLPPFYSNTNAIETIFARIENIVTGCHSENSFQIEILVAPTTTQPSNIVVCDDDQDGFSIVNLDVKIDETVATRTGHNISIHNSFDDADTNSNPISNSELTAYNSNTQTLYIRVEDALSGTGCYAIEPLEIIVNTLPDFPVISNFQICQIGGNTADFLLSDKDSEILNGQTGKDVYYFADPAFTVLIDKNTPYQNTSTPQTIYVRVENISDPTCFGTSSFILQVSPDPVYNPIIDYLVCDDSSNDGKNLFDLDAKRNEIAQGSPDILNISFHLTQTAAENNTGALPNQYTNATNPQTLYVRIESNDSFCYLVEQLGINIIAAPDITTVSSPLVECDTDYDGFTVFNLETADFQILDRVQSDLIINYFENESDINPNDGLDNTNEITNPSNYISNSRVVYIKVANTLTGCYSVIPLQLNVNLPPPTNNVGTVEICDNDTNTFDLSEVDSMLVNNLTNVTITYHDTQIDAEINSNPLPYIYNYTSSNHTIFTRVADNANGCFYVSSFNLQINQNPIANTPQDLIDCDDDFDGILEFNLSVTASAILGVQNTSTHTITYYSDYANAETATNPLFYLYEATNADIIYARLENNITGCFDITQFSIFVNPLPIIPIDDIVPLCINNLPLIIDAYTGNPNDTYLWSTGETTSQIQLNSPSDFGNYYVTATTPNINSNDCSYTKLFSVIESEDANINFTTKVDFADPNSITVDISGIGDYVFILDDGEPQTSNIFENVTFGLHIITIRDLNGCKDVTTEVVVIDIPKFFTPNNDSYFDTWHIVGVTEIPGTIVYIYNRYGKLLKTLKHTSIGWDGTFNGENMPADDYWFVAKVIQNGSPFDIKGHFALKR
jgi:gliding motility-associated-like protein